MKLNRVFYIRLVAAVVLLSSLHSYAEFAYTQYPIEFAQKVIPSPQRKSVTWGQIQNQSKECVAQVIESLVRSTYLKSNSKFVIENGLNKFWAAQNGPSYGAFGWSDRFYFEDNPQHKAVFYLSQSTVLTEKFKDENGVERPFYYNGPFGFTIADNGRSLRYNFKPFFSRFYLDSIKDEVDKFSLSWGFEQALPILFVEIEDKGAGMTSQDLSFDKDRIFEEVHIFNPFYFKEEKPHAYIGDQESPVVYDRKSYIECLLKITNK